MFYSTKWTCTEKTPRSRPKKFTACGEDGQTDSACHGKGLQDVPWGQGESSDSRALEMPGAFGVSVQAGRRARAFQEEETARSVGDGKQQHVFRKYQWPLLMEHKGTRWRGAKHGSVEGQAKDGDHGKLSS